MTAPAAAGVERCASPDGDRRERTAAVSVVVSGVGEG
jgi:hypothetical protein